MFKNEYTKKLGLVMGISITMLLFCLGVVQIHNSGNPMPVPVPVIVLIFAMMFILGTIFCDHRGGTFPWTLLGGSIIAVISTVQYVCIFSGMVFIVTGNVFAVPWDVFVYLLSACMVLSVILLNIIPHLPEWISKLSGYLSDSTPQYEPDLETWQDTDRIQPPDEWKI